MRMMNNVKTTFLLASLIGLCMAIGYMFGGWMGLTMGFVLGGLGNIVAYYNSDKIAVAAMGGREVAYNEAPWLHDMIENLASRAGLPKPKIYVCPQAAPNAFATGRDPKHAAVAISEGMVRSFPREEIEGVMAHELAHVKHRDVLISTIASVMGAMISYAAWMMMWFGGGNNRESPFGAIGALAMVILAPIAAMIIQMAISRQREYAADSYGAELAGDPIKLSSALRRLGALNERIPTDTNPAFHSMYIVAPLSDGGIGSLFSTHPPLERRIAKLEAMPGAH